jgi:hypothetical protein
MFMALHFAAMQCWLDGRKDYFSRSGAPTEQSLRVARDLSARV